MHLKDFEPDSQQSSPFARVDPRVKIICAAVLIASTVSIPQESPVWLWGIAVLLALLSLPSRVPARYIAVRLLIALPFLAVIAASVPFLHGEGTPVFTIPRLGWTATAEGLQVAASTAAKSGLCIWTATLLGGTTDFTHLVDGLGRLRAPSLLVILMAMIYRYLFVIGDEALRMVRAREARGRPATRAHAVQVAGSMIGTLMLRCFERSERISRAMVARGFDGTLPAMHPASQPDRVEMALGAAICLVALSLPVVSRFL